MSQYRVPVLENYEFQPPVIDKDLTSPPGSPAKGDRYIVADGATGDWSGKGKKFTWYDGAAWKFDNPIEGHITWVKDEDKFYTYNGSSWLLLSTTIDWANITSKPSSTTADIDDAVSKKHSNSLDHEHSNKATLDAIEQAFTTALKSAYDGAVTNSHTHTNKATLDAIEQAFTTALKANYDTAYNTRAQYDADLGCITFNI